MKKAIVAEIHEEKKRWGEVKELLRKESDSDEGYRIEKRITRVCQGTQYIEIGSDFDKLCHIKERVCDHNDIVKSMGLPWLQKIMIPHSRDGVLYAMVQLLRATKASLEYPLMKQKRGEECEVCTAPIRLEVYGYIKDQLGDECFEMFLKKLKD
jgi:hypothetical protein